MFFGDLSFCAPEIYRLTVPSRTQLKNVIQHDTCCLQMGALFLLQHESLTGKNLIHSPLTHLALQTPFFFHQIYISN